MEENKKKIEEILGIIRELADGNDYGFSDYTGDYNCLDGGSNSGYPTKKFLSFQKKETVDVRPVLRLEITFTSRRYRATFVKLNKSKNFPYSDSGKIKMRGVICYWLRHNGKLPPKL